jgi:hypothetical protein
MVLFSKDSIIVSGISTKPSLKIMTLHTGHCLLLDVDAHDEETASIVFESPNNSTSLHIKQIKCLQGEITLPEPPIVQLQKTQQSSSVSRYI